ncbi:hypothetical protein BDM02DRAFT_3270492 [Thelephora ganbajun]|uniref:Uncharacterized protein n=1 Tax=Thelephora ganbajun TaxID=370292 RepID=A0ACB6ZBF0_THEGA|nr:hypothetical protein BDM02DRAFT_3270492 [Thelephora ganbajun]
MGLENGSLMSLWGPRRRYFGAPRFFWDEPSPGISAKLIARFRHVVGFTCFGFLFYMLIVMVSLSTCWPTRRDLPLSMNAIDGRHDLEASIPEAIQFHWSVTPLFIQKGRVEGDRVASEWAMVLGGLPPLIDILVAVLKIPSLSMHGY